MRQAVKATCAVAIGFALAASASVGEGQAAKRDSAVVTIAPGPHYRTGPLPRTIVGSGWRDVWVVPAPVPVIDLSTYAGGLKFDKRAGGFQSITLHFTEKDGWQEYRFRSVDKFPMKAMPDAVKGTYVGEIIQDQVSTLFPAAPLMVPPLMEAIGALHVNPRLYVMSDDPRLGVHRDTVAGMLGTMELKGEEAPDDKPGFGGSQAIKETEKFFEDLEESRAHRLDEGEFLAARLIDFLINDTDRTRDNFDWARFGDKGAYTWRPIARDRDGAFMDADGLMNRYVSRAFQPRLTAFSPRYSLRAMMHSSHWLDRRLLQRLTREDFERISLRVRDAITDDVIDRAIAQLPNSWRETTAAPERLRSVLRARRDGLPAIAMKFYNNLATEVDVHGTKQAERTEVVRHPDGRVTVMLTDPEPPVVAAVSRTDGRVETTSGGEVGSTPFFVRTFSPGETKEVRLYVGGGDDRAVVRGTPSGAITVRIIGGPGDDVLVDSTGGSGGATHLYDAEGNNRFETTSDTRVSTRPWTPPKLVSGLRVGQAWRPDWGGKASWKPALEHGTSAGVILGFGPTFIKYGFRRLPYHWKAGATLLVGTGNGRLGVDAEADYRMENSPMALTLYARASQLEAVRFNGFGNNTAAVARDLSVVEQNTIAVEPALVWHVGWRSREGAGVFHEDSARAGLRPMVGEIEIGPMVRWIDPQPFGTSPLATTSAPGQSAFGHAGARLGLELDRTDRDPAPSQGWKLQADLEASPAVWGDGQTKAFATSRVVGAVYLPLAENGMNVALKAGGALASRGVPVQYAPFVGGWSTMRGYSWRRYAGDAAVSGSTELRVPVGTVNLLLRWDAGVFGLADVGRVWFDGQSDGGWHTGFGGGIWLAALGRSVSIAYARGEEHRFYLKSGLF